jgi:hypothetical protein
MNQIRPEDNYLRPVNMNQIRTSKENHYANIFNAFYLRPVKYEPNKDK